MGKEKSGIERAVLINAFANNEFASGAFQNFVGLVSAQDIYIGVFKNYANKEQSLIYQKTIEKAEAQETLNDVMNLRSIALK